MKLNIKSKFYKVMLSFALLLTTAQAVFASGEDNILGNENISVVTEKIYDEETNTVDIKLTLEAKNTNVSLEGVTFPDESKKIPTEYVKDPEAKSEDNTYVFTVGENGEYEFQANYALEVVGEDEQPLSREETYGFKVNVLEVKNKRETLNDEASQADVFSMVSDGGVSINVPSYDGSGWANTEIKDVEVTVDFGDTTTAKKILEINVAEGMMYNSILVTPVAETQGADLLILSEYSDTDPISLSTLSQVVPAKTTDGTNSTFGKLTYEFTSTTKSVTIKFKVSVDSRKYYGPHTINKAISAIAYKGSPQFEVGETSMSVDAIGSINGGNTVYIGKSGQSQTVPGATALSDKYTIMPKNGNALSVTADKIQFKYFYIEGMENAKPTEGPWVEVERNLVDGYVIHQVSGNGKALGEQSIQFEFDVPSSTLEGEYTAPKPAEVTYTWYNGSETTAIQSGRLSTIQVIDPSTVPNVMKLSNYQQSTKNTDVDGNYFMSSTVRIGNIGALTVTNQTYHLKIDDNMDVTKIMIPVDRATGSKLKNVSYKTNKSSDWVLYGDVESIVGASFTQLTKAQLGITDSDEQIVEFKVEVGKFEPGFEYVTYVGGNLKKNSGSSTITYSMYDSTSISQTLREVDAITYETGQITSDRTVASVAQGKFIDGNGADTTAILAGSKYSVNANIELYLTREAKVHAIVNPEIYIRQPIGQTINLASIKLTDSLTKEQVEWTYKTHVNSLGELIYVIKTKNTKIGGYIDESLSKKQILTLQYDVSTLSTAVGEYPIRTLIGWGVGNTTPISAFSNPVYEDVYDFNGNGDLSEKILAVKGVTIAINENKNMLIDTFITLKGEDPKGGYVEGDSSTISYFTPGTEADYTIETINNGDTPVTGFTSYIPIPKTDQNFGGAFQNESFKWDMTVNGVVIAPLEFTVYYSTDANADNFETSAIYSTSVADLTKVTMIKLVSNGEIQPQQTSKVLVPMKVNETFESATQDNKIGLLNAFNPVSNVKSSTFEGKILGTKVGAELVIAEIGGTIFNDIDVDGLFKPENGDTPIANHVVELYEWNDAESAYKPVIINGTHVTSVSNSNGVYLFDDTAGLGYGNYAVRFVEQTGGVYQYTINVNSPATVEIDSNAIIANDIPNPGDTYRGWVLDINATKPEAKTIGAGFIAYNPPIDLTVTIDGPTEVKSGESITLIPESITPDFWNNIKNPNNPYSWEIIGGTTEQAKASLTVDQTTGNVHLKAASLSKGKTTVKVKLTILDIYGNEAESNELEITILSTEKPVITVVTNPTIIEYGEPTLDEAAFIDRAGISAKDNEGTEISFTTDFDSVVDQTILDDYTVTITATDSFGNTATRQVTVTVQDKTPPVITLAKDTHTVEMAPEVTFESIIAAFDAKATDNYDPSVTVTNNIAEVVKLDTAGSYTVTFTATDTNGNTSTKTATVVIKDETPPNITLTKENVVVEINSGQTHDDILTMIGASVTDNSGESITLSNNISTVKLDTLGTYPVIFTAEDSNGNKASKTATVKVQDTTKPLLEVANDSVVIEINSNMSEAEFLAEVGITSSDNSGETPTITNDFSKVVQSELGDTMVTITAKDSSGNTTTVDVVVTVEDTKGPVINVGNPKVEIEINGGTTEDEIIKLAGITATDNSGETPTITTDFNTTVHQNEIGTYVVTITTTDSEGNESTEKFEVVVKDSIAPELTVLNPEVSIEINGGTIEDDIIKLAGVDAIDNSGETPTITTDFDTAVDQTKPGKYDVIITATDGAGNSSTETIVVTIKDTTAPELTIGNPEVSIEINGGTTEDDIIKLAGIDATDNSGETPTITTDFDTVVDQTTPGDYTVTITVTDSAGNDTTDTIVVTVEDTTSPDLVLTNNEVEINLNSPITEAEFMDAVGASATDNSLKPVKITSDFDQVVDQNNPLGEYTVTITATDEAGNVTTETVTIKILDDENPTVSGGEEYSYVVGGEITLEQLLDDIGFVATDNSDQTLYPVSITSDIDQVDFNTIGSYDVTITVTDVSGNITQHVVTINVVREATHHIVGDHVIIDVNDLGAILALDDVEGKIIELVNGKAWIDDAITGITDLPVFIKNYEEMIKFLSKKDLKNGDVFDVVLTTNNPLSRSPFGSETVAQIEITGVVDTPKLPSTGVAANNTMLYGGLVAIFSGMFLLFAKKKKEDEETAN